jgi:hypothetical protein
MMKKRFRLPAVLAVTTLACGTPKPVADAGSDSGVADGGMVCDGGFTDAGEPACGCGCGVCPPGSCFWVVYFDAGGQCTCQV